MAAPDFTAACHACKGAGERYSHRAGGIQVKCPDCAGTGESSCSVCKGSGRVKTGLNVAQCEVCNGTGSPGGA